MTFRILSFCGGGIRGYLSAMMLHELQKEARKQSGKADTRILDHFDMVAGTSTGAIISALISLGLGPREIAMFYRPLMVGVMKKRKKTDSAKPEFGTFTKLLKEIADTPVLNGLIDKRLSDIKDHKILTTSFYTQQRKQYQPGYYPTGEARENTTWGMVLFHNFIRSEPPKTGQLLPDTSNVRLLDAMAASGAMPGMSGTIPITLKNPVTGDDEILECVDGAFVNHNPTIAAISTAVAHGHKLEDISVIDFGTGMMPNYLTGDFDNWGSKQWLSLPEENTSRVPPLLVNSDTKIPVMNMLLNGTSTNEMPALNNLLLGKRYAYLNADFGEKYIPEDTTKEDDLDFMKKLAEGKPWDRVAPQVDYSYAAKLFIEKWYNA